MSFDRRRIFEEQRKKRIFNEKQRQIGLDIKTLNHQVHENHLAKIREIEWEKAYAEELSRNNNLALLLEQQRASEIREHCKKIDAYRLSVQKPHCRNDSQQNPKEWLPGISDIYGCPISGIQRLEGEDLSYRDRLRKQKQQLCDVLLQQMQEKRIRNFQHAKAERAADAAMLRQDCDALEMAMQESSNIRIAAAALVSDNRMLRRKEETQNSQQSASRFLDDIERKHGHQLNQSLVSTQQKRQGQNMFNTVINANTPTKDFYDQFSTSSR